MGKKLIITEKKSVGEDYASVLGVRGYNTGYIENEEYIITWAIGHLVTMSYPEKYNPDLKQWKLDTLPFIPKEYLYEVIDEAPVKKQFSIIKRLLNRKDIDCIYYAGDSGREGLYIQMLIRQESGHYNGAKEKVVWISSQTDSEIRHGIKDARDISAYANMKNAGYLRGKEDFLTGINFSRVLSVKYADYVCNQAGVSRAPIRVGRVMSCVLGMVVSRERAIRNFKETAYYRIETDGDIQAEWRAVEGSNFFGSPKLYKENGFLERADADALCGKFNAEKSIRIDDISTSIEKKYPPLLFNLAELQHECSKQFKISPDETLAVAQKLYEKKIITYPRTDARVLSSAVASEISNNLKSLISNPEYSAIAKQILDDGWEKKILKSRYVDDAKITDHYALIPTGEGDVSSLTGMERKVYNLIVIRLLSIFYPPAEYYKTELTADCIGEKFFGGVTTIKSPGWQILIGYKDDLQAKKKAEAIQKLQKGIIYPIDFAVKEGKTQPPKRYNSGNLILAMENAGNLIEEEELREQIKGSGIGTSATRAEIIKKLITIGYIDLNTKTQIITPSEIGEYIYDVLAETIPGLLNPKLTANWEKGLAGVADGTIDAQDYEDKMNKYILEQTEHVIKNCESKSASGENKSKIEKFHCPKCNGKILAYAWGYSCEHKKEGQCDFSMSRKISGKELTDKQIESLFMKGKTGIIKGFTFKSGKKGEAGLIFKDGKLKFYFEDYDQDAYNLECPHCSSKLKKQKFSYKCDCGFNIYHTVSGKKLSEKDMKSLLAGRTGLIKGFKSKSGKKFDAILISDDNGNITFKFD